MLVTVTGARLGPEAVFAKLDVDGDGNISLGEMWSFTKMADEHTEARRKIPQHERFVLELGRPLSVGEVRSALRALYTRLDSNADDKLSEDELRPLRDRQAARRRDEEERQIRMFCASRLSKLSSQDLFIVFDQDTPTSITDVGLKDAPDHMVGVVEFVVSPGLRPLFVLAAMSPGTVPPFHWRCR